MNKSVQILLIFALLPMAGIAREETLEERKQRIVRKYLRERMTITQSDMVVPSDLPEDERITDSEKLMEADVDIQREDGISAPMAPPPRPRPVPRADSNWLLGETDDASADPYGNPYATQADPYSQAAMDSGEDLWSSWGERKDRQAETQTSRSDRRSDPNRNDPYSSQGSGRGIFDGRAQQEYSTGGTQQGSGFGSSSPFSTRTDSFGNRQGEGSSYSSGLMSGSRTRPYSAAPDQGMLKTPFPQIDSSSSKDDQRRQSQGYQPYKSPYEQQREDRRQQQGMQVPQQKQPEFQRPDAYQQWKQRNKTWDPTQDDAYTSEMMQQNKR